MADNLFTTNVDGVRVKKLFRVLQTSKLKVFRGIIYYNAKNRISSYYDYSTTVIPTETTMTRYVAYEK